MGANALLAQTLSGIIASEALALPNANILAFPVEQGEQVRFAISNNQGAYHLELEKGIIYNIEVSYLGYQKLQFQHKAEIDEIKNLELIAKTNDLDEVVLEYKIPIEIKEDTITYQTDAFTDGTERKLREVLKKLPGLEVDREGNVTAKGKKVTKVLVENETFFTGNSKLAVNNIPADAVSEVELLDNYNEIGFLKGLQDTDEMALNIKLKEDKKKFAFGDVEVSAGPEQRFLIHPNLFYYSPKTNINFIGDANNVGQKSFTLGDYLEFNGGFGKLMADMGSYARLSNDDFSQFLLNNDFKENTNRFGALNLRQDLTEKSKVNTYFIANHSTTQTEQQNLNIFLNPSGDIKEQRNQANTLDNIFMLGKLNLDYEPSTTADLAINSFIKLTNNRAQGILETDNPIQNNFFNTNNELDGLDFKQNLAYSKRFSRAQTISLETTLQYNHSRPINTWQSNQPFLQELLPLVETDEIKVFQTKETEITSFDILLKDYWVLNSFNHIYTTLGYRVSDENFLSDERQILADNTFNGFSENGFGNDNNYRFRDGFMGLEYKFLWKILTVKSGLFYHYYQWDINQVGGNGEKNLRALLPEFNAELEFNSSEKLQLRYRQQYQFGSANQLTNRLMISSFNSVALGNPDLENELTDTYSLSYYKSSLFRGLNLNAAIFYNRKRQGIKATTQLEGIDQLVTYTLFNQPENALQGIFNYSKRIKKVKIGLQARGNYNEFFQLVNDNINQNISKSYSLTPKFETLFKKAPNIEVGYSYEPSQFSTTSLSNNFLNTEFFTFLEYNFWEDFKLKSDYRRTQFKNQGQNESQVFDIANASLFYQKEDSPWSFEISGSNLFDNRFRRSSSFTNFIISDQTTLLLPRIVLFKVGYKL